MWISPPPMFPMNPSSHSTNKITAIAHTIDIALLLPAGEWVKSQCPYTLDRTRPGGWPMFLLGALVIAGVVLVVIWTLRTSRCS